MSFEVAGPRALLVDLLTAVEGAHRSTETE